MPTKGGSSSQEFSRAWLVFKTRLAALKSSQRSSAASDVVKAAQALDQAANVTRAAGGVHDSPSGLSLSAAFQLARDAGVVARDLGSEAVTEYLDQGQQRTCIRAVLKAVLAALPVHARPGDTEIHKYLYQLALDPATPNLLYIMDNPCMDRFKYRPLAVTPNQASPVLHDMLLFLAVVDRIHTLLVEWETDMMAAGESPSTPHSAICVSEIAFFNAAGAPGMWPSWMEVTHQAVSLALHMVGAKPPAILYKTPAEPAADGIMAKRCQPAQALATSPGAWHSPLNLMRRALDIIVHRANPGLWDLYRESTVPPVMNILFLAASGIRDVIHGEKARGKASELGATPALMQSLVHALSFMYTRFVDDEKRELNRMSVRRTVTSLSALLEVCFDCTGMISIKKASSSSSSSQVQGSGGSSSQKSKKKRKGKGTGHAGVENVEQAPVAGAGAGTGAGNASIASSSASTDPGSTNIASGSTNTGQASTSSSTAQQQQQGQQEQGQQETEEWLKACDAGAWGLYRVLHVVSYPDVLEKKHRYDITLETSSDASIRLESLYWVPLQTVKVAWSLGKALPVQDILAGTPGSTAFAAAAASTAMVQACCLVSDAWSGGGHPVALEVAPYCRKLLKYLLPAIQALQEQYNSASLPTPIPQTPSALSSTPSSASAATSSTVPTATTAAGTEADDSSGAGGDVCDVSAKCEASTQTDGSNARPQVPDKQQLQITLLLILAALHVSQGLGDSLIQSERSLKVEEWDTQLVTLGCGALSLLCDLLHNKSWRSAAQAHQPLLLLHATYTGLQVALFWTRTFNEVLPSQEGPKALRYALLNYASELDSSGESRTPFASQVQIFWVVHQALRRCKGVVGDGKPGVRWNPHDECHTLHVNSAVEQSLVTLQYLLRSYVTSTIIANLARSRRLSESDSQSTDNTQSSASGAAAGSSHSTGNIESRGLGMTPQQLLALGASLAHMLPPSNLWRVVEEDCADVRDWATEVAPPQHVAVLLLGVAAVQVASTALDLEGQPTPHKLREEHIDRLRDLLGGGGDNVPAYEGELPPGHSARGPERDAYLLHHATTLLRSLPELRSALLPAFMDRLPHLFDIYKVDPNSGVQEILTSSKISWSSETVIEDAATPEHRQYIDWLCGHLAAILRGCFQRQ